MPEKEWPTRTVGPSWRSSTRCTAATGSGRVVNGFCTAVQFSPLACSRAMTSVQQEPSAKSPCARTTLRAFNGAGIAGPEAGLLAAMPRVEIKDAAAPATSAVEKFRLVIIIIVILIA